MQKPAPAMSVVLWGSMERRMRDIYGSVAEIASRPPTICGGSYGAARHVAAEGRVAWLLDSAAWPGQLGLQFSPFRRTRHPRLRMSGDAACIHTSSAQEMRAHLI